MDVPPELVERARRLTERGRAILGITGPPGAGKSVIAEALAEELDAVVVGMDGFHLPHAELVSRGLARVKGSPPTFDAEGYVALLAELARGDRTVRAPRFHRELEDPVADEIEVPPQVRLVVTAGTYLLLDQPPWSYVRPHLAECWYVDIDDDLRRRRLLERRLAHGESQHAATDMVQRSDEANAAVVAMTRSRADLVL